MKLELSLKVPFFLQPLAFSVKTRPYSKSTPDCLGPQKPDGCTTVIEIFTIRSTFVKLADEAFFTGQDNIPCWLLREITIKKLELQDNIGHCIMKTAPEHG